MSYDKQSKSVNRYQTQRVIRKQKAIFVLYNEEKWLTDRKVGGFNKRKSMNCSCATCRRWDHEGKQARLNYQLQKTGMGKNIMQTLKSEERYLYDEHDDL